MFYASWEPLGLSTKSTILIAKSKLVKTTFIPHGKVSNLLGMIIIIIISNPQRHITSCPELAVRLDERK